MCICQSASLEPASSSRTPGRAVRVGPGPKGLPPVLPPPQQVQASPPEATEVRPSFPLLPLSLPRSVLAPEYIWGQEVAQAVNSWINSEGKKKNQLVYSGRNASCLQNLTSLFLSYQMVNMFNRQIRKREEIRLDGELPVSRLSIWPVPRRRGTSWQHPVYPRREPSPP